MPYKIEDMNTIELENATAPLAEYAHRVNGEPFVLTVEGRPVAALVNLEEDSVRNLLELYADKLAEDEREFQAEVDSLGNNPEFIALIGKAIASLKEDGGTSAEDFRRELGL